MLLALVIAIVVGVVGWVAVYILATSRRDWKEAAEDYQKWGQRDWYRFLHWQGRYAQLCKRLGFDDRDYTPEEIIAHLTPDHVARLRKDNP